MKTDMTSSVENAVEATQDSLRQRYESARVEAAKAARRVREGGEEAWDRTLDFTRKHPAVAVGAAVTAGTVLGAAAYALLAGRRESRIDRQLRRWENAGREGWGSLRDFLDKGISGLKEIVQDAQALRR